MPENPGRRNPGAIFFIRENDPVPELIDTLCTNIFYCIFAARFLSRGVMVALQILVLPAQVRVLAGQQKAE